MSCAIRVHLYTILFHRLNTVVCRGEGIGTQRETNQGPRDSFTLHGYSTHIHLSLNRYLSYNYPSPRPVYRISYSILFLDSWTAYLYRKRSLNRVRPHPHSLVSRKTHDTVPAIAEKSTNLHHIVAYYVHSQHNRSRSQREGVCRVLAIQRTQ